MKVCFHCMEGRCSCITCEGKCQACAGREKIQRELELADHFGMDVRNIRNYEFVRMETGGSYRRLRVPKSAVIAA